MATDMKELGNNQSLVSSHVVRPFTAPWWLENPHAQTLVGAGLGPWERLNLKRRRVETADGDFIEVDILPGIGKDAEVGVVVCHGIEASGSSPLPRRLAAEFARRGWTVLLINNRGTSAEPHHHVREYHLGFTDDVLLVAQLAPEYCVKRTYLAGYSLGGNMICKLLGDLGASSSDLGIQGAVAFSTPFGPGASNAKMSSGLPNLVYRTVFLWIMKSRARRLQQQIPAEFLAHGIDMDEILRARTVPEFDAAFTCKAFHFDGLNDYYDRVDGRQFLRNVRTPLLVINSRDDPIVDANSLPTAADCGKAPIKLYHTDHGGHCGFIDADLGTSYITVEVARFFDSIERETGHMS